MSLLCRAAKRKRGGTDSKQRSNDARYSRVNIHDTSRTYTTTTLYSNELCLHYFDDIDINKYKSNFRNKRIEKRTVWWKSKMRGNRVSSKSFQSESFSNIGRFPLFCLFFPFDKSSMCLHNASPSLPKLFVPGRHKCREEDWKILEGIRRTTIRSREHKGRWATLNGRKVVVYWNKQERREGRISKETILYNLYSLEIRSSEICHRDPSISAQTRIVTQTRDLGGEKSWQIWWKPVDSSPFLLETLGMEWNV